MPDSDYQSLKDSISEFGVLNPITIFEGQVIDGWHRYRAANELALECPEQEFDDWIDPKDFVLAQNKNRRHITAAQLATATAAVYGWRSVGSNQHKGGSVGPTEAPKSAKELAAIAGVSTASIEKAKVVQAKAAPEVQKAVRDGKIGLEKAVAISKLPQEQQKEAINKPLPKKVVDIAPSIAERKLEAVECELDATQKQLDELHKQVALNSLPEDERVTAAQIIETLESENKQLRIRLKAAESQRDQYMSTCAEMEKQIKYLQRRA